MKQQFKRLSGLLMKHPVGTLVALSGGVALLGVSLLGAVEPRASRPTQVAQAARSLAVVSPATVSPFGVMPTRTTGGAPRAQVMPAVWTPSMAASDESLHVLGGLASSGPNQGAATNLTGDAQDAAPPGSGAVVAPADLKSVHPPRLYVASVPEPSDIDADGQKASAALPPAQLRVPLEAVTRQGTGVDGAGDDAARLAGSSGQGLGLDAAGSGVAPAAATATVSVYTPAQIRQAYGFAALPDGTLANKSAYQGAGQIIVILDAYHNATAGADLNTFSTKFGLPTCTLISTAYQPKVAISALVSKPAAGDGCAFQTLYVNSAGAQAANPPAVNASWAIEIALDVQWVHAIAPKAKIVLVEAASASGNDLMNAMTFASKLGASAVSMSFGASEFASAPSYDWVMGGTGVTWVAASGDNGAGVSWPASSKNVLAVGGTLLNSVSPRAETAWSGSGGGRSAYVLMPTWQSSVTIAGNPANTLANLTKMRRGVPDVAYNASPYSGFYVYQSGRGYLSVGGTSAGTPQWAALVGIIDGVRGLAGRAAFSGTGFQQAMYGTAASAGNYKATLLDVTAGANGTCAACVAGVNYDLVTGLGTPNVVSLVSTLAAL
jgi:hypothetical protein